MNILLGFLLFQIAINYIYYYFKIRVPHASDEFR